jgi:bacterioferritin-associated ferredoxin
MTEIIAWSEFDFGCCGEKRRFESMSDLKSIARVVDDNPDVSKFFWNGGTAMVNDERTILHTSRSDYYREHWTMIFLRGLRPKPNPDLIERMELIAKAGSCAAIHPDTVSSAIATLKAARDLQEHIHAGACCEKGRAMADRIREKLKG